MKLLANLLVIGAALQLSTAWVLEVNSNSEKDGSPVSETFSSREAENGCYEISTAVQKGGVHDFQFCTIQMYGCQVSFYSDIGCKGDNLGHSGGRGYSWKKDPVSKTGSAMKSFRITGCRPDDIPIIGKVITLDTMKLADC